MDALYRNLEFSGSEDEVGVGGRSKRVSNYQESDV